MGGGHRQRRWDCRGCRGSGSVNAEGEHADGNRKQEGGSAEVGRWGRRRGKRRTPASRRCPGRSSRRGSENGLPAAGDSANGASGGNGGDDVEGRQEQGNEKHLEQQHVVDRPSRGCRSNGRSRPVQSLGDRATARSAVPHRVSSNFDGDVRLARALAIQDKNM
jgi:hypothetical protein